MDFGAVSGARLRGRELVLDAPFPSPDRRDSVADVTNGLPAVGMGAPRPSCRRRAAGSMAAIWASTVLGLRPSSPPRCGFLPLGPAMSLGPLVVAATGPLHGCSSRNVIPSLLRSAWPRSLPRFGLPRLRSRAKQNRRRSWLPGTRPRWSRRARWGLPLRPRQYPGLVNPMVAVLMGDHGFRP